MSVNHVQNEFFLNFVQLTIEKGKEKKSFQTEEKLTILVGFYQFWFSKVYEKETQDYTEQYPHLILSIREPSVFVGRKAVVEISNAYKSG